MSNNDKIDAIQSVMAAHKAGTLKPEDALAAIDKVVNPVKLTRREANDFRQKLYQRHNEWRNVP